MTVLRRRARVGELSSLAAAGWCLAGLIRWALGDVIGLCERTLARVDIRRRPPIVLHRFFLEHEEPGYV